MKKWIAPACVAIAFAIASHIMVLYSAPNFIMDRAMQMLEKRGVKVHQFKLGKRLTPQTQSVVRASPDLTYSSCLFDLNQAPDGIMVRMAQTSGYASLAFFDTATNNFKTIRGNGAPVEIKLTRNANIGSGSQTLVSPTAKGIIIIRRLAPTADLYSQVAKVAVNDSCAPV